jgi:hypothetical protein
MYLALCFEIGMASRLHRSTEVLVAYYQLFASFWSRDVTRDRTIDCQYPNAARARRGPNSSGILLCS